MNQHQSQNASYASRSFIPPRKDRQMQQLLSLFSCGAGTSIVLRLEFLWACDWFYSGVNECVISAMNE